MVKSCAAINCTVRHNKGVKIKFHRFPKNPRLRELWLKAVTRANYRPSDFAVICQNHFREDDYVINVHGNTVLREGSVPSVFNFPHLPSIKEEKTILERTQNECGEDLPASDEMQIPGKEILVADRISATETATVTVSSEFKPNVDIVKQPSLEPGNRKRGRLEPLYIGDFRESDLECPRKRNRYWTISQQVIKDYRKHQKHLRRQITEKSRRIDHLSSLLEELKSKDKLSGGLIK